jgi:hypothetical protein
LVVLGSGLRRRTVVSSAIGMSLAHDQRGRCSIEQKQKTRAL